MIPIRIRKVPDKTIKFGHDSSIIRILGREISGVSRGEHALLRIGFDWFLICGEVESENITLFYNVAYDYMVLD